MPDYVEVDFAIHIVIVGKFYILTNLAHNNFTILRYSYNRIESAVVVIDLFWIFWVVFPILTIDDELVLICARFERILDCPHTIGGFFHSILRRCPVVELAGKIYDARIWSVKRKNHSIIAHFRLSEQNRREN